MWTKSGSRLQGTVLTERCVLGLRWKNNASLLLRHRIVDALGTIVRRSAGAVRSATPSFCIDRMREEVKESEDFLPHAIFPHGSDRVVFLWCHDCSRPDWLTRLRFRQRVHTRLANAQPCF